MASKKKKKLCPVTEESNWKSQTVIAENKQTRNAHEIQCHVCQFLRQKRNGLFWPAVPEVSVHSGLEAGEYGENLATGTPLDLGCTHTHTLLQSIWQVEPLT